MGWMAGFLTKSSRRTAGDRAGALAAYEESLGIMRELAAADPGDVPWR